VPTIKELLVSLAISEAVASIAVVSLVGFILEFELHYLIVPLISSLLFYSPSNSYSKLLSCYTIVQWSWVLGVQYEVYI